MLKILATILLCFCIANTSKAQPQQCLDLKVVIDKFSDEILTTISEDLKGPCNYKTALCFKDKDIGWPKSRTDFYNHQISQLERLYVLYDRKCKSTN